jgi:hypothetical protein
MRQAETFEIRNRMALFGWGFMVVWLAMLVAFTWIMARDGPHPSQPAWVQQGALALFWIVGLPASGYVFSLPCTRLRVDAAGSVVLTRRTPFAREVETYAPGSLAAIEVRAGKDGEGDPYWETFIIARDGRERMIREGRVPAEQEALAARLREALGLA